MAYNVSSAFREQLYSGESNFRAILTIGENTIDNDQIASISISSPIIDDSKQVFYVGSFISQKITIKFKNMDGIDVHSGDNVDLSIGQYVNNEWVDVPIGKFLVDDLAEDYFEKCEISCLDYAVKFKPNIDYSLCFTDGKATIKEILEYICDYFNVEIGDYPTINDDVEIGTYDSTVSGKQWISYIAELKGCNAKIDRLGRLTLQPLKQSSNVPINALESASFELGEEFNITKVTFFDAIRNYTYGDDEGNTLFIRQDNPFITDANVVQNIYDTICVDKYSASGKSFDLEDVDAHPINVNTIYGETSQNGTPTPSSPIPINNVSGDNDLYISGTNIFDKSSAQTGYTFDANTGKIVENANNFVSDLIKVRKNTDYYVNSYVAVVGGYDINKNYIGTLKNVSGAGTFNSGNAEYIRLRAWWVSNPDTQMQMFLDNAMCNEGIEAKEYEEYVGIKTASINLPVENLLDYSTCVIGDLSTTGAEQTSTIRIRSEYIEVQPNTYYNCSLLGGNYTFFYYTSSKTFISGGTAWYNSGTSQQTPATAKYLRIKFKNTAGTAISLNDLTNVQLEQGTKANAYTPYGTTPIELCKIGTYQDKIFKTMGKNLNKYPYSATSFGNGITFTASNDGIITLNGQNDGNGNSAYMFFNNSTNPMVLEAGTYYIIPPSNTNIGYVMYDGTRYYSFSTNNRYSCTFSEAVSIRLFYIQVARGNTTTFTNEVVYPMLSKVPNQTIEDYEPYGSNNEWYLKKAIGKYILTGATNESWYISGNALKTNQLKNIGYSVQSANYGKQTTDGIFSNYGTTDTRENIYNGSTNKVGLSSSLQSWGGTDVDCMYVSKGNFTVDTFKAKLASSPLICNYVLATPEYQKITYQPLIDQLNELQNTPLFEGTNHITVDTLNEVPTIDIDYYKNSHFNLWSLKTHNFGDFTLDAWDNIDYDLDGTHYLTLNNNTITYEMSIMSDVDTKIPNKQQTATTNIIGGDDKTNIKIIKTNVDNLNASVNILSKQQTDAQTNITQLQLDVNGINQTVEHIENTEIGGLQSEISSVQQTMNTITDMFQITGGINIIRNSAFLLQDELWEFTDYGTSPYHTPLGNSYNSSLSGITVSVAEIKARSMKIKSKSENITNLKTDGTKYTFNFYHKQDTDMTTTIKMYSTENNNIKAFNDIVITGQQPLKNYEVSFVPTYANYTLEIIVASATSIGYAYLYDMMLNAGDKQSWQPASDEIYSTTLQMSRLGLQVYSVGDGTITLLGSDGSTSWETSDGKTKGRLVSKRTIDGDRVKTITTQSVKLVSDATKTDEELTHEDKWVETTTKVSGKIAKVIYMESGV